ncbi:MAG: glycogen debranching protein GlgX [Pseudomonadota bacterium]|jgi:glycogen operon protein
MDGLSPGTLPLQPGRPWPLGVHWDGQHLNIAVHARHAQAIELCLFERADAREAWRARLPARTEDVWHGRLAAGALAERGLPAGPGLLYGLRAHGPWRPERGQRHNPRKLLLDPWARQIVGRFDHGPEHMGHDVAHPLQPDPRDNAATALKCRVVAEGARDGFDWQDDTPPAIDPRQRVIYELHVRGFSRLNEALPPELRGTYAGLAHPASIAWLQRLGVTTLSLLPVQHKLDEARLADLGLSNYWGYNTLGFFCPEPTLAADPAHARDEFRAMVRALHRAGLEVVLDVVYNHTAESDEHGPTLCWRGLDNAGSYRLPPERPAGYENPTGTGNALDLRRAGPLQLVLDSLRFWVREMHVDGFRFDLAPVLARGDQGFERDGPFFRALAQDPVLRPVWLSGLMIAEPWDIGPDGWQVGAFPRGWREWNDGCRDTLRAFWLGGATDRGAFAHVLAGSAGRFQARGRSPLESVNYVVSHDGFTLRDLVSFDQRHNAANGEHNRDGHGHNLSWNCGHEGATDDPEVLALRARLQRALLATLALAQGTPMLAAGDELGHSQGGNNNPYCQDNATTWIDWAQADHALADFSAALLRLRRVVQPLRADWYTGVADAHGRPDLGWLRRGGGSLGDGDWRQPASRVLGALVGATGGTASPLLLLFNAEPQDADFALPASDAADRAWQLLLDSSAVQPTGGLHAAAIRLPARSVLVLDGSAGRSLRALCDGPA